LQVIVLSDSIGDDFQRITKYKRGQKWYPLDWAKEPDIYKTFPTTEQIELPIQFPEPSLDLIEILKTRASLRHYSSKSLQLDQLAFLLWASTGIRQSQRAREFRVAPSAGALYPIETYILVNKVEGLAEGIYHYNIASHTLEQMALGNFAEDLANAALEQKMCIDAPVVFIWTAIFERSRWKYKQRAYRYIYLDAGHIAQNLALSATSIGLGSCQIGAIFDDEINKLLGIDGTEESAIYLSVVGHPK
jgi:SagB-type dehydrogenase family enzyme